MGFAATLIVDASYCHETKSAGYGYCISYTGGRLTGGDGIKRDVENTNAAEMMGIVNTLCIALKNGIVTAEENVLIQTDSEASILAFQRKRIVTNGQEIAVVDYFLKIVKESCVNVTFRHVKGHTNLTGARYVTNRLCDQRAKAMMREVRRKKLAAPHINQIQEVLNGTV